MQLLNTIQQKLIQRLPFSEPNSIPFPIQNETKQIQSETKQIQSGLSKFKVRLSKFKVD